jgi:hypothetical protein
MGHVKVPQAWMLRHSVHELLELAVKGHLDKFKI